MPGRQMAFLVDTTKCINCRTCEVACKDAKAADVGVRIRRVRTFELGTFPRIVAYNVSMSCNHCADPACLRGCPTGAYTKRESDGVVVHDGDRCIGCRYCTWVCPYGAPQFDAALGRIRKCDFCSDELAGRPPVCVTACPMRVIEVGWLDELQQRAGATAAVLGVPEGDATMPACVYIVRQEATRDR